MYVVLTRGISSSKSNSEYEKVGSEGRWKRGNDIRIPDISFEEMISPVEG